MLPTIVIDREPELETAPEPAAAPKPSAVATAVERQVKWAADCAANAVKLLEPQQRLLAAESEWGKPFDFADISWTEFIATVTVESAEQATELLRVLARHGFRRREKSEPSRDDVNPTRVRFALEKLDLTVINKGATCRRVKTGEQLVDVYEVVCDDAVEVNTLQETPA